MRLNRAFWKDIFELDASEFPVLHHAEHQICHDVIVTRHQAHEKEPYPAFNYTEIFREPDKYNLFKTIELKITWGEKFQGLVDTKPIRQMDGVVRFLGKQPLVPDKVTVFWLRPPFFTGGFGWTAECTALYDVKA